MLAPIYDHTMARNNQPLPSDKPLEHASNGSFTDYARICYMLHGMLVVMHTVLLISSILHWEHHITLPFTPTNDDFWRAVLSISLQGFYTVRA